MNRKTASSPVRISDRLCVFSVCATLLSLSITSQAIAQTCEDIFLVASRTAVDRSQGSLRTGAQLLVDALGRAQALREQSLAQIRMELEGAASLKPSAELMQKYELVLANLPRVDALSRDRRGEAFDTLLRLWTRVLDAEIARNQAAFGFSGLRDLSAHRASISIPSARVLGLTNAEIVHMELIHIASMNPRARMREPSGAMLELNVRLDVQVRRSQRARRQEQLLASLPEIWRGLPRAQLEGLRSQLTAQQSALEAQMLKDTLQALDLVEAHQRFVSGERLAETPIETSDRGQVLWSLQRWSEVRQNDTASARDSYAQVAQSVVARTRAFRQHPRARDLEVLNRELQQLNLLLQAPNESVAP